MEKFEAESDSVQSGCEPYFCFGFVVGLLVIRAVSRFDDWCYVRWKWWATCLSHWSAQIHNCLQVRIIAKMAWPWWLAAANHDFYDARSHHVYGIRLYTCCHEISKTRLMECILCEFRARSRGTVELAITHARTHTQLHTVILIKVSWHSFHRK